MFKQITSSLFLLGLSFATIVPSASATNQGYAGGALAFFSYSEDGVNKDLSLNSLYGRFGRSYNENFSTEVRLGFGVGDDSFDDFGSNVKLKLDNFFGVYFRGSMPITEAFSPYAAIGYTNISLEASLSGFESSFSESDISFGLGFDFKVEERVILNLEYMQYLDKSAVKIDGVSLGAVMTF